MAKKKGENPADLTEEEQVVMDEQEGGADEAVDEEGAQGDEALSADEPTAEAPEEKAEEPAKVEEPVPPTMAEKAETTTVPLAALDSERHKRKEAEGRLAVLEDKMARLEAPQPAVEAEDKMPDPVVDPEGFEGWLVRRDAKNAQPVHQMTEEMRRQQHLAQLRSFAAASETTFTTENADYPKALDYARDLYSKDFRRWGHSEEKVKLMLDELEVQITTEAHVLGKDPATMIYDWAKAHGYKAETKDESPGDKIARLAETQKTTQSTAGAGGTAREDEWTAERISLLNDKEMAELPDAVFERVMGG